MRRRTTRIGATTLTVVVIAFGAVMSMIRGGGLWPFSPGLPSTLYVVCPGQSQASIAVGATAIQPRNDCTPSFTAQDARDYISQHGIDFGMSTDVVGRLSVHKVAFITIDDLGRASGDSEFAANYPADLAVCYVEVSGTFSMSGPLSQAPAHTGPGTAFILFDAHTGNELMSGGGWPAR